MRFAKNLAGTLLGWVLVLLLLPPVPGPVEKDFAQPLLAQRADCSVLFIGPSYVDRQVKPDIFNREAGRIGSDAKACKFATGAFRGFEMRLWIERLLAHDWPRLELVFIDITLGPEIVFEERNWFTGRVIEWHTWDSVPWLLDYYERYPPREKERFETYRMHASHVALHHLAVGKGLDALVSFRLLELLRRPQVNAGRLRENPLAQPRHRRGPPSSAALSKAIDSLKRNKAKAERGDPDWPLELRDLVRARGKEAYFLIAPVLYVRAPIKGGPRKDRLVVLDFNDPEQYPELYALEARGSTSHLGGTGPAIYSELLAHSVTKLQRQRRR